MKNVRFWIWAVVTAALALSVGGCGSSFEPSETSIYVQKDGKVTYAVVESFDKEYYSLEEFQTMIEREVTACNGIYSEPAISIKKLEVKDGTLYLLMDFTSAEAYGRYSEEYCFVGTIDEALESGKSFDTPFKDKNDEERTTAEVTGKKNSHVLIVQSEGIVELEKAVKYVSGNVEILSAHKLRVAPMESEEEYAYIVY